MSFDSYVRPSNALSDTNIPLGCDGVPILRWELAIKKAERAQARAAEELARQQDRDLKIEPSRYIWAGEECS